MLLACVSQAPLPRSCVRAHVLAQEHGVGINLQREPHRFLDDVALSEHEPAASLAQLSTKVSQRAEEKGHPIGCAEAGDHRWIEDEERCNGLRRSRRGCKRRVIVKAEIAREEDDRDAHG
jgi:hypothetical protein